MLPPLLIGFTFLLTLFFIQHNNLERAAENTTDFEVTNPVPPLPESAPTLPVASTPTPVNPEEVDMVACTMDVMQCPDGSFVGRIPPSCEFDVCPIPVTDEELADLEFEVI